MKRNYILDELVAASETTVRLMRNAFQAHCEKDRSAPDWEMNAHVLHARWAKAEMRLKGLERMRRRQRQSFRKRCAHLPGKLIAGRAAYGRAQVLTVAGHFAKQGCRGM